MSSELRLAAVPQSLFSQEEWSRVQDTLARLNQPQMFWLSGYLAAANLDAAPARPAAGIASGVQTEAPVMIAYGGETGNSKALAGTLQQKAQAAAVNVKVEDLARIKLRQLARESTLIVICSTHGDGDPPEPITQFHEDLSHATPGSLKNLSYAVLALGDSSYDKFCQTGRDIDLFLEQAGAKRLFERVECDVDFAKPAEQWMQTVLGTLGSSKAVDPQALPAAVDMQAPVSGTAAFTKDNPCVATVLESVCLSADLRQEKLWHLEIEAEGQMDLQPGDAVGVLPRNSTALIDTILDATGLNRDTLVQSAGAEKTLFAALQDDCDLVLASKGLLEKWGEWSGSAQLLEILAGDATAVRQYLKTVQLIDLLRQFPVKPDAAEFVANLRPLQPRLYDLANLYEGSTGEMHLLVKHYQYWFGKRVETGVASAWLANMEGGNQLRLYPHHNRKFRLAGDSTAPLILLAEGTGIAPYRAFIEKLRAQQQSRPCWVLFQEMQYEEDFLYQLEWQQAVSDGLVTHFDGVFVNDDATQSLQQRVLDESERFLDWMQRGAEVYLCGDRKVLTECELAISAYYDAQLPLQSVKQDGTKWKELGRQGRIHKNLY